MTPAGLAPNVRGALWMLTAACSFTAMTALVKFLGADYPPALQAFYRQAAAVIILFPMMARDWRGTRPASTTCRRRPTTPATNRPAA